MTTVHFAPGTTPKVQPGAGAGQHILQSEFFPANKAFVRSPYSKTQLNTMEKTLLFYGDRLKVGYRKFMPQGEEIVAAGKYAVPLLVSAIRKDLALELPPVKHVGCTAESIGNEMMRRGDHEAAKAILDTIERILKEENPSRYLELKYLCRMVGYIRSDDPFRSTAAKSMDVLLQEGMKIRTLGRDQWASVRERLKSGLQNGAFDGQLSAILQEVARQEHVDGALDILTEQHDLSVGAMQELKRLQTELEAISSVKGTGSTLMEYALDCLKRIGDKSNAEQFVGMLSASSQTVRSMAATALEYFGLEHRPDVSASDREDISCLILNDLFTSKKSVGYHDRYYETKLAVLQKGFLAEVRNILRNREYYDELLQDPAIYKSPTFNHFIDRFFPRVYELRAVIYSLLEQAGSNPADKTKFEIALNLCHARLPHVPKKEMTTKEWKRIYHLLAKPYFDFKPKDQSKIQSIMLLFPEEMVYKWKKRISKSKKISDRSKELLRRKFLREKKKAQDPDHKSSILVVLNDRAFTDMTGDDIKRIYAFKKNPNMEVLHAYDVEGARKIILTEKQRLKAILSSDALDVAEHESFRFEKRTPDGFLNALDRHFNGPGAQISGQMRPARERVKNFEGKPMENLGERLKKLEDGAQLAFILNESLFSVKKESGSLRLYQKQFKGKNAWRNFSSTIAENGLSHVHLNVLRTDSDAGYDVICEDAKKNAINDIEFHPVSALDDLQRKKGLLYNILRDQALYYTESEVLPNSIDECLTSPAMRKTVATYFNLPAFESTPDRPFGPQVKVTDENEEAMIELKHRHDIKLIIVRPGSSIILNESDPYKIKPLGKITMHSADLLPCTSPLHLKYPRKEGGPLGRSRPLNDKSDFIANRLEGNFVASIIVSNRTSDSIAALLAYENYEQTLF